MGIDRMANGGHGRVQPWVGRFNPHPLGRFQICQSGVERLRRLGNLQFLGHGLGGRRFDPAPDASSESARKFDHLARHRQFVCGCLGQCRRATIGRGRRLERPAQQATGFPDRRFCRTRSWATVGTLGLQGAARFSRQRPVRSQLTLQRLERVHKLPSWSTMHNGVPNSPARRSRPWPPPRPTPSVSPGRLFLGVQPQGESRQILQRHRFQSYVHAGQGRSAIATPFARQR